MILDEDGAEYVWATKDGQGIPISQLTDIHLANIVKYLEKQERELWSCVPCFQGEQASFDADRDFERANEEIQEWIGILNLEAKRRQQ